ncbi:hypothetical protein L914_00983 [Phytophthora nicotianae]|uniref:Uncharacterized protein n=1 Tax=Phytophthora nicotianae TaxID=4792 RepID=W2JT64_PHYNI|nr:hypothetical protein L916_00976 [Phytophthora nicotianae]ETM55871.1 hypothetical protein L914_00983 [Phytophthora nicotianae]
MARSKKAIKDDVRRKSVPWESDRVSPDSPSSMEVLMTWLTTPSNAERWRREKRKELIKEIIQVLAANGIQHRAVGDVHSRIWFMEKQFTSASAFLTRKNQLDSFQRGEADPEVSKEVLKLCPQYQELVAFFGGNKAGKKTQVTPKSTANGAATSGAKGPVAASSSVSAAGEWKKNLEKDRRKATSETTNANGQGEKVMDISDVVSSGEKGSVQKEKLATKKKKRIGDEKAEDKKASGADAAASKKSATVAKNQQKTVDVKKGAAIVGKNKPSGAGQQKNDDVGKQAENIVVEEEEDGVLADVEDGHSDVNENKQSDSEEESAKSEGGEEETDTITEQAEAHAEGESSEEEKPQKRITVRTGVRSPFRTKPQHIESGSSSSEEEESGKSESDSEKEDGDGEERIPLAQPDEVDSTPGGEDGEQAEQIDDDDEEENGQESKADESEETEDEEEAEEEPTLDISPKAADPSDDSDSNSSSENEAESEEETPPTQLKTPSDQEEESDEEELNAEDNEDDVDMEKDVEKSVGQSELDSEKQVDETEPEVESSTLKRSISSQAPISPRGNKRSRTDGGSNSVTRDLEREAFIERAKQEREQRDELFKIERAKLECELQAKQVQLAMDRSLARKKLLGAGIDPAEVDRVLPLHKLM